MVLSITRWSPSTCGCVIEQVSDTEHLDKDPEFLLMNEICERHMPLASTKHRADHSKLASNVMKIIEDTKQQNLDNHTEALNRVKKRFHKRQVENLRGLIERHNNEITEEWNELVSFPYAFDSHIWDAVWKEIRQQ